MTRTVLVTDGAGYVGSHTCKALARAGWLPVVYDNLCRGHRSAVRWGPFEQGDLHDRVRLEEVMKLHRPEAVLHFAAYAYVGESIKRPGFYWHNNVGGTASLLEAMRACAIGTIIFSSSCATYGLAAEPIRETTPQNPINPYGASKLAVEHILAEHAETYGLRWAALRYFNAAGADADGEIGEAHAPETHLIPLALQAALGHRPGVSVLGDDYPTPDGSCVRDYVHVSDLADAHVLALRFVQNGGASQAFNLSNGNGFSVHQVLEAVRRVSGRTFPITVSPRRPGDPPQLVGCADKAQTTLGWQPRHPNLDQIIDTAWRWECGGKQQVLPLGAWDEQ